MLEEIIKETGQWGNYLDCVKSTHFGICQRCNNERGNKNSTTQLIHYKDEHFDQYICRDHTLILFFASDLIRNRKPQTEDEKKSFGNELNDLIEEGETFTGGSPNRWIVN